MTLGISRFILNNSVNLSNLTAEITLSRRSHVNNTQAFGYETITVDSDPQSVTNTKQVVFDNDQVIFSSNASTSVQQGLAYLPIDSGTYRFVIKSIEDNFKQNLAINLGETLSWTMNIGIGLAIEKNSGTFTHEFGPFFKITGQLDGPADANTPIPVNSLTGFNNFTNGLGQQSPVQTPIFPMTIGTFTVPTAQSLSTATLSFATSTNQNAGLTAKLQFNNLGSGIANTAGDVVIQLIKIS